MKIFNLIGLALAQKEETEKNDERKVPDRHPIQRLNSLVKFSHELLDDWFSFLPSQARWKDKFEINAARMEKNFLRGEQKCGFYDDSLLHGGPKPENKKPAEEKPGKKNKEDSRERRNTDENEKDFEIERYDRTDPRKGTRQITTGFRKWAERYIASCSGQATHKYQVTRMNKWNGILQAHLARNDE